MKYHTIDIEEYEKSGSTIEQFETVQEARTAIMNYYDDDFQMRYELKNGFNHKAYAILDTDGIYPIYAKPHVQRIVQRERKVAQ